MGAKDDVEVWVDQDLCTGDGLCVQYAPDVFEFDVDGLAYVKDAGGELQTDAGSRVAVPSDLVLNVIDSAKECPGECIHVLRRTDGVEVAGAEHLVQASTHPDVAIRQRAGEVPRPLGRGVGDGDDLAVGRVVLPGPGVLVAHPASADDADPCRLQNPFPLPKAVTVIPTDWWMDEWPPSAIAWGPGP